MNIKSEWKSLTIIVAVFIGAFYLPINNSRFENALMEGLYLVQWYAREHVILCLIPAFFIAGAIAVFISKESVMKYLGAGAKKVTAYGVASTSGTILAVCSCTILPLFAGIYRMGAGLGPAIAFLYSGPAINIMAIILTGRVLGLEIGIARAVGAVLFSVVIGLTMQFIFRNEKESEKIQPVSGHDSKTVRPMWHNLIYFGSMIGILVFSNWGKPVEPTGFWSFIFNNKWVITGIFSIILGLSLIFFLKIKWWKILTVAIVTLFTYLFFNNSPMLIFTIATIGIILSSLSENGEPRAWTENSWDFAKQIMPLLFFGVIIAGILLGRPGHEGLIPSNWISDSVGGNSLGSNFFASIAGAFMYFATLTEVPILQGLMGNGMGKGPALALLLAGPALSLPNMLVIKSVIGTKKTLVYIILVVIMSTVTGKIYGALF